MKGRLYLFIALALFAVAFATWSGTSSAQTAVPQLLVNWRADSYAPPDFEGKVLPTSETGIVAGVDLIDRGRRVDLSSQRVLWYLNGAFYQGGTGATRIRLSAPRLIGNTSVELRVAVPDYGGGPAKTTNIPIATPEITITSTAPGLAAASTPFTLQARPYFFNIQDPSELNFSWKVGGAPPVTQNPFTVTPAMAESGRAVSLELTAENPLRRIERIVRDLTLFPDRRTNQ